VPNFLLPSPIQVIYALVTDMALLASHAATTLVEAAIGLALGVASACDSGAHGPL